MTEQKDERGLLPCPWCGAFPAVIEIYGTDMMPGSRGIFCRNPNCAVRPSLDAAMVGGDSGNARYRWNTRAAEPTL
jgi:hypothetical protein